MAPRKKTNTPAKKATASGASKATTNTKNRSGNPTKDTKGKGKAPASKKPTGITKKSNLRRSTSCNTHAMETRSKKKTVKFAELADIAYFAANSLTPTGNPPPPPPPPSKTNKVVYYLEKDQMDVLRDHHNLTQNPEHFDWTWIAAHMKRLPPGKLGPRGCIKLIVNMPEELGFMRLPKEIKVVDTRMHEEGGEEDQDDEQDEEQEDEQGEDQDEDQEEEEGLESPPPIDNFDLW
jgi:hypothetical protein